MRLTSTFGCFLVSLAFLFTVNLPAFAQSFDTLASASITPVQNGTTGWADVDNDGFLDLLMLGEDATGTFGTKLYLNNKDKTFTLSPHTLPVVRPASANEKVQLRFHDFNNDNRIDIFLLGKLTSGNVGLLILENKPAGFAEVTHGIEVNTGSRFVLTDFDNNGSVELLLTSVATATLPGTRLYSYRSGEFKEMQAAGLPAAKNAVLLPFDFNKDSQQDILILGTDDADKPVAGIFINTAELTFKETKQSLAPLEYTSGALLDYNDDGDFDVVVTGKDATGKATAKLYTYSQGKLTAVAIDFSAVLPQEAYAGDLDNDGKPDIILSGFNAGGDAVTRLFNWQADKLVLSDTLLPVPAGQSLALADFDNDYNLDLFITGRGKTNPEAFLLLNTPQTENKPPFFPGDLFNIVDGDTIRLYWQAPPDNATSTKSLTYSINIQKVTLDSVLVASAISSMSTRKIVAFGQQSATTELKLWNLPEGSYTWTVSAVDNSYISSKVTGGGGGGGSGGIACPLVFSVYRAPLTEVCENQTVNIQPTILNGKSAIWSSTTQGPLGTGTSISFKATRTGVVIARVLLASGCFETFTFPVKVNPVPKISVPGQLTVCPKEEVKLQVNPSEGTVAWRSVKKGILSTGKVLSFKPTESDKIYVEVTTGKSCVVRDSVQLTVRTAITVSAGADKEICPRDAVAIGPGNEISESEYTFEWLPAAGLSQATAKNPMARPAVTTKYYIKATNKTTGCFGIDSVEIKVKEKRVLKPGADRAICLGDATQLGGAPTVAGLDPVFQYEWSPAASLDNATSSNPVAMPQTTTKYRLIVRSVSCPADTAYVTVTVNQPPPSGNVSNFNIFAGDNVALPATGGVSYKWTPATGLDNPASASPMASPMVSTTYTVEITDANGCKGTNQYRVDVQYTVFVPNLFSPNGDGNNDNFKVYGPGIKNLVFQVFTRSGQLLYETNNLGAATGTGWDGRFKGQEQPTGTYIWSLSGEMIDGTPLSFQGKNSGKFTLIR